MEVNLRNLTELRAQQGLSRRKLALKAGLSPNAVSTAERRGSASMETLRRLAEVLGVRPEELLAPAPPPTGLEAFFESQRDMAAQALESIRGAERALRTIEEREAAYEFAETFLGIAKSCVRRIEQAQREAMKIERGHKPKEEEGSDSQQASADPSAAPDAQEGYESISQT
jgi:transcriptional regulator with XRE-family HTH domain